MVVGVRVTTRIRMLMEPVVFLQLKNLKYLMFQAIVETYHAHFSKVNLPKRGMGA